LDQYLPTWISALSRIDDILYSIKAPQLIDLVGLAIVILAMAFIVYFVS